LSYSSAVMDDVYFSRKTREEGTTLESRHRWEANIKMKLTQGMMVWTEFNSLEIGLLKEHGNEFLGYIKSEKFLDFLSDY